MATSVAGIPGLDPTLPDVSLVVGGKKYQLMYDLNALILVQNLIGVNVMVEPVALTDPKSIRALLFAALMRQEPEMVLEQAGALVTPQNWKEVADAILKALSASQAEPDPTAAGGAENPSNA